MSQLSIDRRRTQPHSSSASIELATHPLDRENGVMAPSTMQEAPPWVKLVSGSVGSIVTALTVTPLEVVKVRQQAAATAAYKQRASAANVSLCPKGCGTFVLNTGLTDCLLPKSAVPYFDSYMAIPETVASGAVKTATSSPAAIQSANPSANLGTIAMMRRIFAKEGFRGIYSGLGAGLIMGVPNTVLYFVTYEELMARWRNDQNQNWIPALCGASARVVASAATAPFELVRTRQAAAATPYRKPTTKMSCGFSNTDIANEFREIVRREGTRGLYKGLSPTLMRDVPFSAIYWTVLEQFRAMWRQQADETSHGFTPLQQFGQALFNGSVSGMVAAACTTPLDVVKTRRQTALVEQYATTATGVSCDHQGATAVARSAGTFDSLRSILLDEGFAGLWRGNVTRMIKVAPACAIMLSSYEMGKRLLSPEDY